MPSALRAGPQPDQVGAAWQRPSLSVGALPGCGVFSGGVALVDQDVEPSSRDIVDLEQHPRFGGQREAQRREGIEGIGRGREHVGFAVQLARRLL